MKFNNVFVSVSELLFTVSLKSVQKIRKMSRCHRGESHSGKSSFRPTVYFFHFSYFSPLFPTFFYNFPLIQQIFPQFHQNSPNFITLLPPLSHLSEIYLGRKIPSLHTNLLLATEKLLQRRKILYKDGKSDFPLGCLIIISFLFA